MGAGGSRTSEQGPGGVRSEAGGEIPGGQPGNRPPLRGTESDSHRFWGHDLLLAWGDLDARPPPSAGPAWHQHGRCNQITRPSRKSHHQAVVRAPPGHPSGSLARDSEAARKRRTGSPIFIPVESCNSSFSVMWFASAEGPLNSNALGLASPPRQPLEGTPEASARKHHE